VHLVDDTRAEVAAASAGSMHLLRADLVNTQRRAIQRRVINGSSWAQREAAEPVGQIFSRARCGLEIEFTVRRVRAEATLLRKASVAVLFAESRIFFHTKPSC